jgi:hypothetical protein
MSTFSSMQDQPQVDSMAKTLYSSGLIKAAGKKDDNNRSNGNSNVTSSTVVEPLSSSGLIKAAGKAAYHATRTKSALTREAEKAEAKGEVKRSKRL